MKKLEHIGIAVKDLEKANAVFSRLLGLSPYKTEEVESEGVRTSFFELSGLKIELLAATRPDSPIARFLEKRGEGIHHLAFMVDNLEQKTKTLQQSGFKMINERPKKGADQKMINFLHPQNTCGVLVEICKEIDDA